MVRYLLGLRPGFDPDSAWLQWVSPLIAMMLVLSLLYILGLFARSWVHRAIDWTLLHVPVVTTIYKAIRNVFQSLDNQLQGNSFKRVVLIPYPFEGSKVLGFVTKTLSDATTGQSIACVCVLTGVMPPAGITLFVPEENVIDVDWTVNQALQAIVSGGITIPSVIHYTQGIDPRRPARSWTGRAIRSPMTPRRKRSPTATRSTCKGRAHTSAAFGLRPAEDGVELVGEADRGAGHLLDEDRLDLLDVGVAEGEPDSTERGACRPGRGRRSWRLAGSRRPRSRGSRATRAARSAG